jgi:hypothetical protein
MDDEVYKEWGILGLGIFKQVRQEMRTMMIDDVTSFKAQVRTVYNSYLERAKNGDNVFEKREIQKKETSAIEMMEDKSND